MKKSGRMALQVLEAILFSFLNLDDQAPPYGSISPETLCSGIADQLESTGYKLFAPLDFHTKVPCSDGGIYCPTALMARTFVLTPHERMLEMLLFWLRNGLPVGAYLLSYAARLAYEAYISGCSENSMVDDSFAKLSDSGMLLLHFHVDGLFSTLNGRKEDFQKSLVSTSKMDKELANKLVENAFSAYRCFVARSNSILHKEDDKALSKLLFSDITSCSLLEREKAKFFCSIFCHLADLCTGDIDIIKLLVSRLDHADLIEMQFEIGLNRFSIFGENSEDIFHLMKNSLYWDPSEQHKLWGLIRSELAVSKVQVEKIVLKFFCSSELDANSSAISVEGLLTLCRCRAPTPELVGAIMLLPNNVFQNFAATVLSSWVVSNSSMLCNSLTQFSEKLDNKNEDAIGSVGITMNHSAIFWLMNYFKVQGVSGSDILTTLTASIPREKPA